METLVLHGSPRKNRNSDTLAKCFLDGLTNNGDFVIRHFYLNEMNIRPCQGCLSCAEDPDHRCIIQDDMRQIYNVFPNADLVVFVSPMYWGYLTAQIKTALDRMEALTWEHFDRKTFVVILTYHHHYQSAAAFFERICPHFEIDLHMFVCRTYDPKTGEEIPVIYLKDKQQKAFDLGLSLAAKFI